MVNGPTIFRSTVIRPYHRDPEEGEKDDLKLLRFNQNNEIYPGDKNQSKHEINIIIRSLR
jgi:hypothetical protein